MRISVVIPAYNAENTISRAIDSCFAQTLPPAEIIVVNDHSSDNTAGVVERYPSVRLFTFAVNSGPAKARNKGWERATGDIVAFLDADDTWHPEKLQILAGVFTNYPHISFLGHPYTLQGFETKQDTPLPFKKSYASILASNPFQSSCIAVRRGLKERFNNSMRYCEDHEFALRVAYQTGCYMLPLSLTRLGRPQLTGGGASGNLWKMRKGELKAYSSVGRHNPLFTPFIPLLWLYSLLKHLRQLARSR